MDKRYKGFLSYFTGHLCEQDACRFLTKKGYRLIAKNFRPARGMGANELDLIMLDKKTLVFIEVKKRMDLQTAAFVFDERLQKRLYKGAEVFLSQNSQYAHYDCRFDVVLLDENKNMQHLQNVLEEI